MQFHLQSDEKLIEQERTHFISSGWGKGGAAVGRWLILIGIGCKIRNSENLSTEKSNKVFFSQLMVN